MTLSVQMTCDLIATALDNKYPNADEHTVRTTIKKYWNICQSSNSLKSSTTEAVDLESDVQNQVTTLHLIDTIWWKDGGLKQHPIFTIHKSVFGYDSGESLIRTTEQVDDYCKELSVPPQEITARLNELENLSVRYLPLLNKEFISAQALYLSYIYSSIIRLHPFQDGNGRTARMYVYYALRLWNKNYFIIPKVRNNPEWKNAVSLAVDGEISKLAILMQKKMG